MSCFQVVGFLGEEWDLITVASLKNSGVELSSAECSRVITVALGDSLMYKSEPSDRLLEYCREFVRTWGIHVEPALLVGMLVGTMQIGALGPQDLTWLLGAVFKVVEVLLSEPDEDKE